MDSLTITIIIAVVGLVIIAFFFLFSKDKRADNKVEPQKSTVNEADSLRFKQVLSGENLDNSMEQEASEYLVTRYTAGTGEGVVEIERILASDPNNVDLLDWLAFMYYSNKDYDKAIETYRRAIAIKDDNENQYYYLANSYYKKKMMSEAKRAWSEVIRLSPNSKIARNSQERISYLEEKGL